MPITLRVRIGQTAFNSVSIPLARARKDISLESYDSSVFINCPFDEAYRSRFEALIFAIRYLGFLPRSALETQEGRETRITRLKRIIGECRFGLHDLSRVELSTDGYPRFNMPLELGIDIGCAEYGRGRLRSKSLLILDVEKYRFQKFISDISGQDPSIYDGTPQGIIRAVRGWLHEHIETVPVGAEQIFRDYQKFRLDEPNLRGTANLDADEIFFYRDYVALVGRWLKENH